MNNKNLLIIIILLVLCNLTSFAQVRIEVVPPFIEGGGDARWENRNSADTSIPEDVFELKNGRTIRGNLESFSGGVYFVNIGGVLKPIPENTISKINGKPLNSIKPTVPDNMTADVKVIKAGYTFNLMRTFEELNPNFNRLMIKNNKLSLDRNKMFGLGKIKGNNNYVLRICNGAWYCSQLIEIDKEKFIYPKNKRLSIPLKIDSSGIYCLPTMPDVYYTFDKYEDVYFYRYGSENLEGPVAKCDNSYLGLNPHTYFAIVDNQGFTELVLPSGLKQSGRKFDYNSLIFYKSVQLDNGVIALKKKYTYDLGKEPDNKYYSDKYQIRDTGYIIGYGSFFNTNNKNWVIVYYNTRVHCVTCKLDTELYIDVFNEDLAKGVARSFHFIIPAIRDNGLSNSGSFFHMNNCIDIDRDGIMEFIFQSFESSDEVRTNGGNSVVIVKLKDSKMK